MVGLDSRRISVTSFFIVLNYHKMQKFKLSLRQKRFLITWSLINLSLLLINIIPIKGDISTQTKDAFGTQTGRHDYYLLSCGYDNDHEGFWPFIPFYRERTLWDGEKINFFAGIFAGYDITEFIVYMLLGFGIIYVPKLWGGEENNTESIT